MSQSSIIFFALFIGFFVYITDKGQLPAYLACIGIKQGPTTYAQTGAATATTQTAPITTTTETGTVT